MGVRESRRIVGDYKLTVEDYVTKADFPDEICRNSYYLDVHYTLEEAKLAAVGKIDGEKRDARYGPGESHGIPYRALLPQGVKNVIVAGRSISCDKRIQGSVRVMPVCLTMGEAAGVAAAVAAQEHTDFPETDVKKIQALLRKHHAFIGE